MFKFTQDLFHFLNSHLYIKSSTSDYGEPIQHVDHIVRYTAKGNHCFDYCHHISSLFDGQFINFDNSEDAFYPQNDTTELLYEIEDRYQASLDFVHVIDEIQDGDMKQASTWEQFAIIEAELSTNERFLEYKNLSSAGALRAVQRVLRSFG